MNAVRVAVGVTTVWMALSMSAYGQCGTNLLSEPDQEVSSSDIQFTPSSPVFAGTNVRVDADIENLGNCYMAFGDNPSGGNPTEEARYNFSFSMGDFLRARVRVRSTSGVLVGGDIQINNQALPFGTNSSIWAIVTTASVTLTSGDTQMIIQRLSSASATNLEIDWIEIEKSTNGGISFSPLVCREAENYNSSSDVDYFNPQDVVVKFYDGDPAGSGTQIFPTRIVGDTTRTLEDSTSVKILRSSATDTATVNWSAGPVGFHDIYVEISAEPNESNTTNNKAFKTIEVLASVPTLSEWGLILLAGGLVGMGCLLVVKKK